MHLNELGIVTRSGKRWSQKTVHDLLTNPKYVGDLAYNQTSAPMGSTPVKNSRDKWTYVSNRFPPIISREVLNRARGIFAERSERAQDGDMLARLRALLAKHGRLSYDLIDAEPKMPSAQTYRKRFGSMIEVYRRIGWTADRRYKQIGNRADARASRIALEAAITSKIAEVADHFSKHPSKPVWTVNDEISIHVAAVTATKSEGKRACLEVPRHAGSLLRCAGDSEIETRSGCDSRLLRVSRHLCRLLNQNFQEQNPWSVEIHRFDDLRFLDIACRRSKPSEAGHSEG